MSGATESPGSKRGAISAIGDGAAAQGDVAALIRTVCGQGVRRGVRVVAADKRGHIFFEQGHVVHAEFGEDVGLGAVIEMLHSRSVEFRPCARPWPSQPTLFFTAEKLLAAARPGAANVITGVRLKPGLLTEQAARDAHQRAQRREPPAAARPALAGRNGATPAQESPVARHQALAAAAAELSRAVTVAAVQRAPSPAAPGPGTSPAPADPPSSIGTRLAVAIGSPAPPGAAPGAGAATGSGAVVSDGAGSRSARPAARTLRGPFTAPPADRAARALSPARTVALAPSAEPATGSASGHERTAAAAGEAPARTHAGAAGAALSALPSPPPASAGGSALGSSPKSAPGSSPKSAPGSSPKSAPGSSPKSAPGSSLAAALTPAGGRAPAPESSPSSAPASTRASAALAAPGAEPARASAALDHPSEPPPAPRPRLPVVWVQTVPSPGSQVRPQPAPRSGSGAPQPAEGKPSTTMVRVSARGTLLAARGVQSEQLADAAAFIHNQARLIAQDLGRHGRTAVHLRGGELSLLVVKSEVNDIAAALGPSERLRSLLRKAGLG